MDTLNTQSAGKPAVAREWARPSYFRQRYGLSPYLLEKYWAAGIVARVKTGRGRGAAVFYRVADVEAVWDDLARGIDPMECAESRTLAL